MQMTHLAKVDATDSPRRVVRTAIRTPLASLLQIDQELTSEDAEKCRASHCAKEITNERNDSFATHNVADTAKNNASSCQLHYQANGVHCTYKA